jgi:hypothetical protein
MKTTKRTTKHKTTKQRAPIPEPHTRATVDQQLLDAVASAARESRRHIDGGAPENAEIFARAAQSLAEARRVLNS